MTAAQKRKLDSLQQQSSHPFSVISDPDEHKDAASAGEHGGELVVDLTWPPGLWIYLNPKGELVRAETEAQRKAHGHTANS